MLDELVDSPEQRQAGPGRWNPGVGHPLVQPTDFYAAKVADGPFEYKEVRYTEQQVSRDRILSTLLLHDGDLLADQSLSGIRDVVTDDQLLEAKLIARKYDDRLKEVRLERARILEQAGVTIEDPAAALRRVRIHAFQLFCEARSEIIRSVLDKAQRKQIRERTIDVKRPKPLAKLD